MLTVAASGSFYSHAQTPQPGMTWEPPAELQRAERDLQAMDSMGVRAIRTSFFDDASALRLADTLGFTLYIDARAEYWPAELMRDSAQVLRAHVRRVGELAASHSSVRYVGLGRFPDTSSPATCDTLAAMTRLAGEYGLSTYVTTAFTDRYRCAEAVDLTLLDTRYAPSAAGALQRYARHQSTSLQGVGIGALGAYVVPGRSGGYRTPHAPAWQARRLERALHTLYVDQPAWADTLGGPQVVFIHRWRDQAPSQRQWGLHTGAERRPAARVVSGFFTGEQTVFAFGGGTPRASEEPIRIVIAWLLIFVLALGYAFSPLMRRMVPRYFTARGFYRESVREGRGTMLGVATVMGVVIAGAFAATLTGMLIALKGTIAAEAASTWWSSFALLAGQTPAWIGIAVVAGVWLAGALIWSGWISFLSRPWYALTPSQALLLVLWPRWLYVPLMMATLAVHETGLGPRAVGLVGGVFVLWMIWAFLRTAYDVAKVTHMPLSRLALTVLLSPPAVVALLSIFVVLQHAPHLGYLWQLLRFAA